MDDGYWMAGKDKARESQNQAQFDNYRADQNLLGPYTCHIWHTDPRHLGFLLARYKFVAKMLEGRRRVLEVGCGDGLGIPVVAQTCGSVHGIDAEPLVIASCLDRLHRTACSFEMMDITARSPVGGPYDAAYSLDVIEHIPGDREPLFYRHIAAALSDDGVLIVGTPNYTAAPWAGPESAEGHINLKTHSQLRADMGLHFRNVFSFGMNDEVLTTGFGPMCHYIFAMGVGVRRG